MKNSIKNSISVLSISMVVITFITTILLFVTKVINKDNIFSLTTLVVLLALILITYILSIIISKYITTPLKKIERSMKAVADGKIINTKHLNEYKNYAEIVDVIHSFSLMMKLIKKNTFDLNSQQSKTDIILEHMADGVIAFSTTQQVVHVNKSAMRLLGISLEDDTFDKISEKLKIKLPFDKIMYLPNYKTIETKVDVNDNTLNIVFVPFFSDRLTPMGVIMVVRNITENVRLDNLRKEFVANVSHELKTPLTSIRGYSETIMNEDLTYQEIVRFAKVINQEANRMNRLVVDLLQLSRLDDKKVKWNKVMFSLEDLSKLICEKMQYVASQKHHRLECEAIEKIPNVYADKDAIEQVLINIISNSIKYTPDGGIIKVYLGYVGDRAVVKVIDNGIGIPEKDLERIFERFYRVDKARSRKMGGTGLGLSIVKEMLDGNDGTIDIKSVVNKGTEVTISLPTKKK